MKRQLFSILLLCLSFCWACGSGVPEDTFILRGRILGCGDKANLHYDSLGKRVSVPVELQDGNFLTEFKLAEPQVVSVFFMNDRFFKRSGRGFIPCNSSFLMFVAQPGQELKVHENLTKDFIDVYPGGDAENDVFRKYTSTMHPLLNDCVNLQLKMSEDKKLTEEEKSTIRKRLEEYDEQFQRIRMNFLEEHVSSVGGLWLLEDMLIRTQLTMEEAERLFQKVDKRYAGLTYYKNIAVRIQGAKQTAVGQLAPAIQTKRTYDGKLFSLEGWRGKYVLVDFWGTWCGACIAGMPEMKKFAAKHADKLMLLGIAKESDEQRWRNYLDKSEWNWRQIISGEGEEDYISRFNVQGFPTKILIGPDGKILKRLVGEEPGFYAELEELMR